MTIQLQNKDKETQTLFFGDIKVEHTRWENGFGTFKANGVAISYTALFSSSRNIMAITTEFKESDLSKPIIREAILSGIVPVIGFISKRDKMEVIYPNCIKRLIEDVRENEVLRIRR